MGLVLFLAWAAQAQGTGSLTLTSEVRDGDWMVVVVIAAVTLWRRYGRFR